MDNNKNTLRPLHMMPLEKRLMFDASAPVIAGQVFWIDANDTATILDAEGDNAASGALFSGQVATWQDKSGSGFHVSAPTAAERPAYGTNTLNGRGVVTFDGTTDRLIRTGTANITGDDYTAFIVFNRTTASARDAAFELATGASRNGIFINDSGGRIGLYHNGTFYNSSNVYTVGQYEIVSVVVNTTALSMFIDAGLVASGTGSVRTATNSIYIGDDSTSNDQLLGNIAEVMIYDRDLTADERHDVENYLAHKWGQTITNLTPTISINTGATLNEGASLTFANTMLFATDADNTDSTLRYTITSLASNGVIRINGVDAVLNSTFTQNDIDLGLITYHHNGSETLSDSFGFTVFDRLAITAAQTFSINVTPVNDAPIIDGWSQVSFEDFELGATGWNNNLTTTSNPYFTTFLGRFSQDGGLQTNFKTYTLSGNQDYAVITFDFYEIDSWDGENFQVFINDSQIFAGGFTTSTFNQPADGSSGIVSYTIQELTAFNTNLGLSASFNDQMYRFTLTVNTTGTSVKLGFGSTLNQAATDEAWGIDNVRVFEVDDGNVPGPFTIAENAVNGTVVGTITASDPDLNTISYSITGGTGAGNFAINPTTGVITVTNSAALNYELVTSFTLIVRATDNGTPNLFDEETITINLIDLPENTAPVITPAGPFSAAENAAVNTVVGTVNATDAESNTITYSIQAGNTANIFAINASTGAIRIANTANLNFETGASYTLTIRATDNGLGNLFSQTNVIINITNINEAPTFDAVQTILQANPNVVYNAGTGNFYRFINTNANVTAATAAANAATLNGIGGYLATVTSAAENTFVRGLITTAAWIGGSDAAVEGEWRWIGGGAEAGQQFWQGTGTGSAQNGFYTNWGAGEPNDAGGQDHMRMLTTGFWDDIVGTTAIPYVIEWNGSQVMAALQNGPYTIQENIAVNSLVGTVTSYDQDVGDTRTYSITGGSGASLFTINATTGEIRTSGAINFEAAASYTLNLRVQDAGGLFDTRTITINITDVNETPSLTPPGSFNFNENIAAGTVVTTLSATDPDVGQTLTYSIQSGNTGNMFAINGSTGVITFNGSPNFEDINSYSLVVRATDNGTGSLFNQQTLTINILNVNEAPTFDAVQTILQANPNVVYNAATGNFYRYVATGANATAAIAAANAATLNGIGGYLTTITSAAENAFVRNLISAPAWIGGSDVAVEGEWRWIGGDTEAGQQFWQGTGTGSAQNGFYTNWNGGEPNNSGNEDYMQMLTNGRWNDFNGGSAIPYVIEWNGAQVIAALQNGPYTIQENVAVGTLVGTLTSYDQDVGDTRTYSVTGGTGTGLFSVDPTTGEIRTTGAINFEAGASYTLNLRVQDAGGLFDTRTVTINVNDINEAPVLTPAGPYAFLENISSGTVVTTLVSSDEDGGQTITYSIVSGNADGMFTINAVTGEIAFAAEPDFETINLYNLVIRATDDGPGALFDERTVTIRITDINENPVTPDAPLVSQPKSNIISYKSFGDLSPDNLLGSTLFYGERGQFGVFYDFRQILREDVIYMIKDEVANDQGFIDFPSLADFIAAVTTGEGRGIELEARSELYTNLREALEFLQKVQNQKEAAAGAEQEPQEGAKTQSPQLEKEPIVAKTIVRDRGFVDTMTYHEERLARLKAALQG
jgi:hypothetical protein